MQNVNLMNMILTVMRNRTQTMSLIHKMNQVTTRKKGPLLQVVLLLLAEVHTLPKNIMTTIKKDNTMMLNHMMIVINSKIKRTSRQMISSKMMTMTPIMILKIIKVRKLVLQPLQVQVRALLVQLVRNHMIKITANNKNQTKMNQKMEKVRKPVQPLQVLVLRVVLLPLPKLHILVVMEAMAPVAMVATEPVIIINMITTARRKKDYLVNYCLYLPRY